MPETVIVTVRFRGKEQDLEIPFERPISEWEEEALDSFGEAAEGGGMLWRWEGRSLSGQYSFCQYGILDGALLELDLDPRGGERSEKRL